MPLRIIAEPSAAQRLVFSHEMFLGSLDRAANEWAIRKEVLEPCFRHINDQLKEALQGSKRRWALFSE